VNVEKSKFDEQKIDVKFAEIEAQVLAMQKVFAIRGSVRVSWRKYRGRTHGPYYELIFRDDARLKAIYLGRSSDLAERVYGLLEKLQTSERKRRLFRQLRIKAARAHRREKKKLDEQLAPLGVYRRGHAFHFRRPLEQESCR
jgi:hypothetical protein